MLSTLRGKSVNTLRNIHNKKPYASSSLFSTVRETDQWMMWPRENEGNTYAVNWSLVGEGVTPTGNAYRNARVPLLTSMLSAKPAGGKVELKSPTYFGDYKMQEAGDESLSLDDFEDLSTAHKDQMSAEANLFVEDAAIGTFGCVRTGVRVVSPDPAYALISRALLVPLPPRDCDHRARFDGWNLDELWAIEGADKTWDGEKYLINENPSPAKGMRPIVAFVGGENATCAVEFVEKDESIVGANIIIGTKAPIKAMVEAITHASTVVINEQQTESLALPSTSFTKGESSVVVVGADDATVDALVSNKTIYGAYTNILTESGVSAGFNGAITAPSESSSSAPSVVVGGKSATSLMPDNLANPCTHLAFFEKGGKKGTITPAEAVAKIVAIVGESKTDIATKLVKGAKCSVVTSSGDIGSIA